MSSMDLALAEDVNPIQLPSIDRFHAIIGDVRNAPLFKDILEKMPHFQVGNATYAVVSLLNALIDAVFDCPGRDLPEILWDEESIYTLRITVDTDEHFMIVYNPGHRTDVEMSSYIIRRNISGISDLVDAGDFTDRLPWILGGRPRYRVVMDFLGGLIHPPEIDIETEDRDHYNAEDVPENPQVPVLISLISGYRVAPLIGNAFTSVFVPTTMMMRQKLRKNLVNDMEWSFEDYSSWEKHFLLLKNNGKRGPISLMPSWSHLVEDENERNTRFYSVHFSDLNMNIRVLLPRATKPVRGRGFQANTWILQQRTPLEMFPIDIRRLILPSGQVFNKDRFRYKPSLIGTYIFIVNLRTREVKQLSFIDNHSIYDDDPDWITKTTDDFKVTRYRRRERNVI